jgi:PAS domain S-box-containing protein
MTFWLSAIVDSLADAVTSTDLDGTVVTWNRAAEDLYGFTAAEAVGSSASKLLPDWASDIDEMLRAVAAGVAVRIDDGSLTRRDGSTVSIMFSASPIRSTDGSVVGQVSVASDISAHKRAEERFRHLVKSAPDAMVIVAADGVIVEVNEQTERLFGYPADDLVGQPVEILVPDRLKGAHVAQRHAFLGRPTVHGMGVGLAISGRRRDGSEFPIEVSLAPLDLGPDKLVSASVRDVTDRQRAERDLARARDEAVAAAQLKSQFVAMVSHEIRTPMNGVLGLTDLLLDTPLDLTQRRYVETIGSSGRALLTIINDILDFSKMESGRIELAAMDLDLPRVIEEVTAVAAELARDKDIVVTGYYPPALPQVVSGDAGRLRQALVNLVGNAVKFTRRGSVLVSALPGENGVTFAVTDTGIGIQPGDLARLLEPFAQGDDAADRRFGGTGLGLTICRNLVELMGGKLEIESERGKGSRFSFTVAFAPADSPPPAAGTSSLAGRRLLVADGNPTTRRLIDEHARAWGMASVSCANSESALAELRAAAAARAPFEVAVLDQSMFGSDGMSVVDAVSAKPGLGVAHVIVLTSGAYLSDLVAKRTGSVDVMARPVRVSELYNSLVHDVGRHAGSGRHRSASAAGAPAQPATATVLVAEDNEVNQLVAIGTLAALGYRCDVARNGLDAVRLASLGTYAAVLMDCQMPEMDGCTATEEIRRMGLRVPIIAMTAGALEEDRERCLAAGMDDFVTKPIDRDVLRAVLDRWVAHSRASGGAVHGGAAKGAAPKGGAPKGEAAKGAAASADGGAAPHRQSIPQVRDTVADRLALLRNHQPPSPSDLASRVLTAFRDGVPERLDEMATALRNGDAEPLRRHAHDIVGMAGHLGIENLVGLAQDLQHAARNGDLSAAGEVVPRLRAEYDRVNSVLAELV